MLMPEKRLTPGKACGMLGMALGTWAIVIAIVAGVLLLAG